MGLFVWLIDFQGFRLLGFFGLVVCFLESGCECLCDAFFVRILFVDRSFFWGGWCFLFIGLFFVLSVWWMPWHRVPMKDVVAGDSLGELASVR